MPKYTVRVIRCAITDLARYGTDPLEARLRLLERARTWIVDGIEVIQIREKQLGGADLLTLSEELVRLAHGSATRILVNGRVDVAIAAGAQGVHLPSVGTAGVRDALGPEQARAVFAQAGRGTPLISVACHSTDEAEHARRDGASLILFGPVFEKRAGASVVRRGVGLAALRDAVAAAGLVAVLALGGVTSASAELCLDAGAKGFAAIREFA